nr:LOW QUALITY PROTEIN: conserved oligomeric Golgi complex subunit 2-like [Rhipicephalus microplus]
MEGVLADKLLQEPAVSLCFHKDVFMGENFSVDTFVSEHRKRASLEKLRDDLVVHLKFLRSSMIKLINKDYADFVNLSANLVGLDKFIRNISKPLEDLKKEVNLDVKLCRLEASEEKNNSDEKFTHRKPTLRFESSPDTSETELAARRAVQEKKALLHQAIAVSKSVDKIERLLPSPDRMDRWTNEQVEQVAIEVNQVLFYLSKCKQVKLAGALAERVNAVTELLQRHLEDSFLRGLKIDSQAELSSVLRIYATLDRVEAVEDLFRKRIVAPALDEMVNEKVVQEVGLDGVYNQVMMFVSTKCQTLLDLTLGVASVAETNATGYAFLERAILPQLVSMLEERLPWVFNAGDPESFNWRFSASVAFLERLERLCHNVSQVENLRAQPCYVRFMAKWNLAIYFQIRFQEIACQLESAITQPSQRSKVSDSQLRYMQATCSFCPCHEALWAALCRCWDEDVFLAPLSHRFWKLTLQLLARHRGWLQQYTARSGVGEETSSGHEAGDAFPDEENVMMFTLLCPPRAQLGSLLTDTVEPRLQQTGFAQLQLLKEGLDECSQLLTSLAPSISGRLVSDVAKACCVQLKMVPDIPRLYRRTNREVPSKPSSYVPQILSPLATLRHLGRQNVNLNWDPAWTESVLEEVTKQYMTVTKDVLVSVKKMEDSLKRLKRARDRTPLPEGAASDDDKIRLQLYIDVEHFGIKMEELGTPKSKVPSYGALMEIVEAARNSPGL